MTRLLGDRAVVLGASVAGLLAARVLADAYSQVVLIERDDPPENARPRRGVPQARHAHALLARGQLALEELFPGFTTELVARGVPTTDVLAGTRMHLNGHLLQQAPSGLVAVSASRPLLEDQLRKRVLALPAVTLAPAGDAVGLTCTGDGRSVTGVRILRRAPGSAEETLSADLVIDATGRASRTPAWLETLGYPRPPEERVRIDVCYATRRYRIAADALGADLASIHGPCPAHPRGGALARIEHGQWLLTLAGVLGDRPPTDVAGFLDFARSLPSPDIYRALRDAEPLDEPATFRFPASVRRRYERLRKMPEGLIPLGDAVCSFNPLYGQGMTVAALQALALRAQLGSPPLHARHVMAAIAQVIDTPWAMAAGADLAFPQAQGRRTQQHRVMGGYVTRLHAAAAHDATLAVAFMRVAGLVDHPATLFRPSILIRATRSPNRRA
jgi:2-polyprenyl-6-methoxyphenol hydroxylase-like FAD-dependent oxidoreductase